MENHFLIKESDNQKFENILVHFFMFFHVTEYLRVCVTVYLNLSTKACG